LLNVSGWWDARLRLVLVYCFRAWFRVEIRVVVTISRLAGGIFHILISKVLIGWIFYIFVVSLLTKS
jgi:hypothetical protein